MICKREFNPESGYVFPGLDKKFSDQVESEIRNKKFELLVYGNFFVEKKEQKFGLNYFKSLDKYILCYGPKIEETGLTNYTNILYIDTLEESFDQISGLLKCSEQKANYGTTKYFENQYDIDHAEHLEDHSKMIWRKKGALWVAQGMHGKFTIRHLHRIYVGRYEGELKTFNLKPNQYLSKMKEQCEENWFWED